MNIIFAGTPEFALPALKALYHSGHFIKAVYTQPDRAAGRGRQLQQSPIKQFALAQGLLVLQPPTLRDIEQQEIFRQFKPDILVVAAYGLILPKAILEIPKHCINIHASLLPKYRGAAPIHRAILAGETETGISIMQMAEGLDTGPVYYQEKCKISDTDTIHDLNNRLAILGTQSLLYVIQNLSQLHPIIQDNNLTSYASKITKSEFNLDFSLSAEILSRVIRAFYPAQAVIQGQLIKIWQAEILQDANAISSLSKSGTIIAANKNGIDVMTGDGILRLLKLQLPGGKVLSAHEMLNARRNLLCINQRFN